MGQRVRFLAVEAFGAAQHGGDPLLGVGDDGECLGMVGLGGIAAGHLPQVGTPVVDLDAVAGPRRGSGLAILGDG